MVRDAAVAGKALEGAQRLAPCCHHLFQFLTGKFAPWASRSQGERVARTAWSGSVCRSWRQSRKAFKNVSR